MAQTSEAGRATGLLRTSVALLLGAWLGSWFLFAFSVAPSAFRAAPPEMAGGVVGPVIAVLHVFGTVAGVALFLLARALGRGVWHQALPLLMAGLCLASELGVTGAIDEVRDAAFGPEADLEATATFWRLHGISMAIYTAVGVLALLLAGLHTWSEAGVGEVPREPNPPNPAKNRAESPENA